MSDTTKPQFDARADAERLRAFASGLTYNDKAVEAHGKHTLLEVAMRLETGGYLLPEHWPTPTDLQAKIVQQFADVMPVVLTPAFEADAAPVDDHPSELSVAVWEAVQLALGDAYDCMRVWSAWQMGTMHADDFVRVADQASRVDEIATAVLDLLPPSVTKVHTWSDMEALTDEPKVFEAMQAFGEDPTDDHGVFVVEAILGALGLKTASKATAVAHVDGEAFPLASFIGGEPHAIEAAEQPATLLESWQILAKKLTPYRYRMSYNDSYFGEPPGLLKQVVAELERLMPPHPVKAREVSEIDGEKSPFKPAFITFTGADDPKDIPGMLELSRLYPIEWGILFSPKKQGSPRYPSIEFVRELCRHAHNLRLSAHLCGAYSRQVCEGGTCGMEEPLSEHFQRVQLNTTGEVDLAHVAAWAEDLAVMPILQCREEFPKSTDVLWLFDASGGRGLSPASWPDPGAGPNPVGYAGGLNPSNVAAAVDDIGTKASHYWIDMETGVRDEHDRFDLSKCRAVCEAVYGVREGGAA